MEVSEGHVRTRRQAKIFVPAVRESRRRALPAPADRRARDRSRGGQARSARAPAERDRRADRRARLPGRADPRPDEARAGLASDLLQPLRRQGRAVPRRLRRDRPAHREDGDRGLRGEGRGRGPERAPAGGDPRVRRAGGGRAGGDVADGARRLRRGAEGDRTAQPHARSARAEHSREPRRRRFRRQGGHAPESRGGGAGGEGERGGPHGQGDPRRDPRGDRRAPAPGPRRGAARARRRARDLGRQLSR